MWRTRSILWLKMCVSSERTARKEITHNFQRWMSRFDATMKGAAKCDKHCELQNSVNRSGIFERILCSSGSSLKARLLSVSMLCCSKPVVRRRRGACLLRVHSCGSGCARSTWVVLEALLRHRIDKEKECVNFELQLRRGRAYDCTAQSSRRPRSC